MQQKYTFFPYRTIKSNVIYGCLRKNEYLCRKIAQAALVAKLIGPRSYNKVKGEPYECGIPTRGSSWLPVSIGYYLFAILFLIFDVETVFLYPWAVVVKEFGAMALYSIGFFLVVLVFGLAYAWRKGALEWK